MRVSIKISGIFEGGARDQSDRNFFEGEDLDVPTYLRRGIKIEL